ncbi:hypothetical protein ACJQWK_07980 [Exserohilum turcicum]|uniref:Rho-GAP domain-containing protein n=1 Tax=Exserohilum turcicum (strain 28A) TaxID=671987 RepID=R0JIF7_EXST2|nr:uncharacterized protein SETTUDRAFT_166460 [Exserohilum turcica Et28A]EOA81113.1 hypothetical protein SETTUDRAFT_166460 [Exserohilum turcica Et28A]
MSLVSPPALNVHLEPVTSETPASAITRVGASRTGSSPSAANRNPALSILDASTAVLKRPALGEDVQLGMLYDYRTSQFYAGVSLWDNSVVNAEQILPEQMVQNGDFTYSFSLDEARSDAALDAEGGLDLDLGMTKATGAAKYLNDGKSSTHEARINASCTIVRRTRRIPQEILASMQHEGRLNDPRYTHYVGEVVEGGSATLSFVQTCSSDENAKEVLGRLEAKIIPLSAAGNINTSFNEKKNSMLEGVRISYSGAIAESVASMEDARRIAQEMPTKLKQQLNTLEYKLFPLQVLDSALRREIRGLDAGLVSRTSAALKASAQRLLQLQDLREQDTYRAAFPIIGEQIMNIHTVFSNADTLFKQTARRILPLLRNQSLDYTAHSSELQAAVALLEQRTKFTGQFIAKKYKELRILQEHIASLVADGFENHLSGMAVQSLAAGPSPRLLLSFGGTSINRAQHSLQKIIESPDIRNTDDDESGSDSDTEDNEWFANPQTVTNLESNCLMLRVQRSRSPAPPAVTFGIASIDKAFRPGNDRRSRTTVGDIILDYKGKLHIVTGLLPGAPKVVDLRIEDQIVHVTWERIRSHEEDLVLPTTGFVVRYRPRPNLAKDGAFPHAKGIEEFVERFIAFSSCSLAIGGPSEAKLYDDCDYEVGVCVETEIGRSAWSDSIIGRTIKLPSVASRMIDFYNQHQRNLKRSQVGVRPWQLDSSGAKGSLYLGLKTQAERACTDARFKNELAVRIVDVAPEFEPETEPASIPDQDNTIVVIFAGCTGHGKSTEINAFISYLLGGAVDDHARIMVIDDRGANQAGAVTQFVTCYRLRPLSSLFQGKTLLIVDTPGYGDTRGVERDTFVTAAMSMFFKTITHVHAIIFTCRANETRTTLLSPVSTYIFSLFSKDVQGCLQTIYTYSDAGVPQARTALTELKWPVKNGEVEVNNAAFTVDLDTQNPEKVRDWWLMSVKGQDEIMRMLLGKRPVSTTGSADVTKNRLDLE